MRRVPFLLCLLLLTASCANNRVGQVYRTLAVSKQANELALEQAERLKAEQRLSPEDAKRVADLGLKWVQAHNAAVSALEAYALSRDDSQLDRAQDAINVMRALMVLIEQLIAPPIVGLEEENSC